MEQINWYGTYTLTLREVKRFLKVYHQTLIGPAVSALIFLAVFAMALGNHKADIEGIRFIDFMGYGLIIMSIVQNAFANSSSSLIMSKIIGYITDILTPPFGSKEILIAFTLGAVLRGLMVGIIVAIAMMPFISFSVHHPLLLIFYILASCTLLGTLGILAGLISDSFDKYSAITNYVVTPLSFLSGTFYSVKNLPVILQQINIINPFFYMIDGFRYCLTDRADGNILAGVIFLVVSNVIMYIVLDILIAKGWKIKG